MTPEEPPKPKPKRKSKTPTDKAPPPKEREGPLSLYPLTADEALLTFMKADPQKVEERLREKGIKKPKK
ncbi:MAG TPA: hypothetical protein VGL38_12415 [bacterium]|jgi:hypothetical protein